MRASVYHTEHSVLRVAILGSSTQSFTPVPWAWAVTERGRLNKNITRKPYTGFFFRAYLALEHLQLGSFHRQRWCTLTICSGFLFHQFFPLLFHPTQIFTIHNILLKEAARFTNISFYLLEYFIFQLYLISTSFTNQSATNTCLIL